MGVYDTDMKQEPHVQGEDRATQEQSDEHEGPWVRYGHHMFRIDRIGDAR
jgi:hypothetical protein